ncbi:MAG: repeat-associated core protein [Clostridiaceae bacterium]|jgi:ABC-type glycerol-3-phosphate transport system permease component|nr:repeat-associated core protein [Clostridiaceae bacterium]
MGKVINADAYGGNAGDLLSHNTFAYCMNNPVNMSDPSGNWPNFSKIIQGAKNIVKSVVNTIVQHVVTTAIVAVITIVASIGVAIAIKKPTLLPVV